MSVHVVVTVTCEHPGCVSLVRLGRRPVSQVSDASLEARMVAQEAGWATRRNHSGVDLCPAHRGVS